VRHKTEATGYWELLCTVTKVTDFRQQEAMGDENTCIIVRAPHPHAHTHSGGVR